MRVIHLKRAFLAPTETFVYTQITHLRQPQSVVLTRDLRNLDQFPGLDIRTYSLEPPSWGRRWADMSYQRLRQMTATEWRFYCRELDELSPDLFHAHYAVDAAYFAGLNRRFDKPWVVSCYGYDVSSFPRQYLGYGRRYLQRAFDAADLFLAMSQDMKQDLIALGLAESRVLIHHPNGTDLSRFSFHERQPRSGLKVRVLCIGSLEEKKGIRYLIEAFAEVRKHTPNVELRIVGNGSWRSRLIQQIENLNLDGSVTLTGHINYGQLLSEYDAAHIFCLPSVTTSAGAKEGIPTVLVEAQATGLPTVSTWHAGIPEVVIDGETGYLVKERDVDALAERLIHLIDHPESWGQLGRAGRAYVEQHFDANELARKLETIYDGILSARSHSIP